MDTYFHLQYILIKHNSKSFEANVSMGIHPGEQIIHQGALHYPEEKILAGCNLVVKCTPYKCTQSTDLRNIADCSGGYQRLLFFWKTFSPIFVRLRFPTSPWISPLKIIFTDQRVSEEKTRIEWKIAKL